MTPLVVGLGGALGAVARYYGADWVRAGLGDAFPWGTLVVNVTGSLLIGFIMVWLHSMAPSPHTRQLVVIGFLGSFTTFSTFSQETVTLFRVGDVWRAGGYVMASVMLGVAAVVVGAAVAGALFEARG